MLETRAFTAHVEDTGTDDDGRKYMWVRVVNYDTVDTHNTTFKRGVFTRSMQTKLPKLVVGHDWDGVRVIGKGVETREADNGLDIKFRFSDFEDVPEARRYYAHARDGEVDEFSVGFVRNSDEDDPNHRSVKRITDGDLKEVSMVLSGSVPGTKLLQLTRGEKHEPTVDELIAIVDAAVESTETPINTGIDADILLPLASVAMTRAAQNPDKAPLYHILADGYIDEAMMRADIEIPEVPVSEVVEEVRSTEDEEFTATDVEMAATLALLDDRLDSRKHSSAPFSPPGTHDNWVSDAGGLPPFIREVARAVMDKSGYRLDKAIPIAISQIKKMAAKGNKKAIAALAKWEALKAKKG